MNNTIAVFSSSRADGNTKKLLNSIAEIINIDVVDLSQHTFSEFDYEHKNQNDDFLPLIEKIMNYDKIIFVSPIYWYSVTPRMKKFLDRISDLLDVPELLSTGRKLRGKTAYVLCTSASNEVSNSFITAFKDTFGHLGMTSGGYLHASCVDGYIEENYTADVTKFAELFK